MKYVQLIYNPVAGTGVFKSRLDYMIDVFQEAGYELRIHRTRSDQDFEMFFNDRSFEDCYGIIVAGGDGSLNRTVNGMMNNQVSCPVGVIPAGTANDYARHLGIPENFTQAIEALSRMETKKLDLGRVNDRYFINVCSGGLLIDVSHTIEPELKKSLGKLAYYIKGIQQFPSIRAKRFRITYDSHALEEDLYLFLVLNGRSAGGFNRIGEYASMTDGKLDFVGIKAFDVVNMPVLFSKIVRGEHLEDRNILYFQSDRIQVESLENEPVATDVDGEEGPKFPMNIEVIPGGIEVIVNSESK